VRYCTVSENDCTALSGTAVVQADLFNEVHPGPGMPKGAPFWRYPAKTDEKYNFRAATER